MATNARRGYKFYKNRAAKNRLKIWRLRSQIKELQLLINTDLIAMGDAQDAMKRREGRRK